MIVLRYIIVVLLSTILLVSAVWSKPSVQADDGSFRELITGLSVFKTFIHGEIGIEDKKLHFLKNIIKFKEQQKKLSEETESYDSIKGATAKIVMSKLMKEACKLLNISNLNDCNKYLKKLSLLVDLNEATTSFLGALKSYAPTQGDDDCEWIRLNIISNNSVTPEVSAYVASKFSKCPFN